MVEKNLLDGADETPDDIGTSLESIDSLADDTSARANLLVARAVTGEELKEAYETGEEMRILSNFFRSTFLPAILKAFEVSPAGMRAAKNFFKGKDGISISIPKEAGEELFGKTLEGRTWVSSVSNGGFRKGKTEDKAQNILDGLIRALMTQIVEKDSAYVRTELQDPRANDSAVTLEMRAGSERFDFKFSFDPSCYKEEVPGIVIKRTKDRYDISFNEIALDEEPIKNRDLERIDLILRKLEWFKGYLGKITRAGLFSKIKLRIHDLIPDSIQREVSSIGILEDESQQWSETSRIQDEINQYISALKYRKAAKTETLDLKEGAKLEEVRLPGVTVEALEQHGFDYKETFTRDGFRFFLLPVHQARAYLKCMFYVHDGKKLYLRLAYKSQSNQRWRIHSADSWHEDQEGNFGKGVFSYTSETVPCAELDALLIGMEVDAINENGDNYYHTSALDSENNTYREEITRAEKIPGFPFYISDPTKVDEFPADFIPDFSKAPISLQKRPATPFFPNGFEVEEFHFNYKGVKIRIDMAHDETGDVWIDRVERLEVPINSYGIQSRFTDFYPLTLKPFEYKDQVDQRLNSLTDEIDEGNPVGSGYVKQTRILDLLPLVQTYRKQRGVIRKTKHSPLEPGT